MGGADLGRKIRNSGHAKLQIPVGNVNPFPVDLVRAGMSLGGGRD